MSDLYTREELVNTGNGLYTDRMTMIWHIGWRDNVPVYMTCTKGEVPRNPAAEFAGTYDPHRPEGERWNWC